MNGPHSDGCCERSLSASEQKALWQARAQARAFVDAKPIYRRASVTSRQCDSHWCKLKPFSHTRLKDWSCEHVCGWYYKHFLKNRPTPFVNSKKRKLVGSRIQTWIVGEEGEDPEQYTTTTFLMGLAEQVVFLLEPKILSKTGTRQDWRHFLLK